MKNMVKIALVLAAIVALATVAQAGEVKLDKYTTSKLINEVLSSTAYNDLLPGFGNSFVSGDRLFQRVSAPAQTYNVGNRHELYLSDRQGFTFHCRPGERISQGIRDLSKNIRGESWYVAIPLKANAKDMRSVTSTAIKNIGIRLDLDVYGRATSDSIVTILTRPVIVRDNWSAYNLSYSGYYYCNSSYAYDYGEVIPAGTVVVFVATGQPAMRKSVSYASLGKYGEFTGNNYGAWLGYRSKRKLIVANNYYKAITTRYLKSGPETSLTNLIDGDAYVIKTADLENRSGKIRTAEQLLALGVSGGWWLHGVQLDHYNGKKEVIVNLCGTKFRLSKNMTYNAKPTWNMPFADSDMSHLDDIKLEGRWIKMTKKDRTLGYVSIIVDQTAADNVTVASSSIDSDDWRDGLTDAEIAEIEAEAIVDAMGDTADDVSENDADDDTDDASVSNLDDNDETDIALSDNGGGCNATNHGLLALVVLGFVTLKRS